MQTLLEKAPDFQKLRCYSKRVRYVSRANAASQLTLQLIR